MFIILLIAMVCWIFNTVCKFSQLIVDLKISACFYVKNIHRIC